MLTLQFTGIFSIMQFVPCLHLLGKYPVVHCMFVSIASPLERYWLLLTTFACLKCYPDGSDEVDSHSWLHHNWMSSVDKMVDTRGAIFNFPAFSERKEILPHLGLYHHKPLLIPSLHSLQLQSIQSPQQRFTSERGGAAID